MTHVCSSTNHWEETDLGLEIPKWWVHVPTGLICSVGYVLVKDKYFFDPM